mgnify:CR=1 FL=1
MITLVNLVGVIITALLYSIVIKQYTIKINHVSIFTSIWFSLIIFSQLIDEIYTPEIQTIILYYIVLFVFLLSSIININQRNTISQNYNIQKVKFVVYLLFVLTLIANLTLIVFLANKNFAFDQWYTLRSGEKRNIITGDSFLYNAFGRLYYLYIPLLIFLFKQKQISKKFFIIIVSLSFFLTLLNFTRAPIIQLSIITYVSYLYIYRVKVSILKLLLIALSLLGVYIFVQIILNEYNNASNNVFEDIKLYIFGGFKSYELIINDLYVDSYENNSSMYSLDFLNYILSKLSIIDKYPSYVRNYNLSLNTNVYTFLDAFTLDFGIIGAIITAFLYGFIPKKIYKIYILKNTLFSTTIYSLLCYYSFMIFMNNELIRINFLLYFIEMLLIENFIRNGRIKKGY